MNWQSLFKKGKEITADQARSYIESQPPGSLQLIDVRQPKEYEEAHIPGAILIPLNELPRRLSEIASDRNTIVYCRSGARSSAACNILTEAQVQNVLNLRGGILQWQGNRAAGDENLGLENFVSGDFPSIFDMALKMEAGLKQFYLFLAEGTEVEANRDLLLFMARLEDGHIAKLLQRHRDTGAQLPVQEVRHDIVEGGLSRDDLTRSFQGQLDSPEAILQLAMMLEAQALDMYSRLAHRHNQIELQSFFLEMAAEEQQHLDRLAREMDKLIS